MNVFVRQFARWMRRVVIDFGGKHEGEAVARDSELALGRDSYWWRTISIHEHKGSKGTILLLLLLIYLFEKLSIP